MFALSSAISLSDFSTRNDESLVLLSLVDLALRLRKPH
jgi:hypothetical protein